MQTPIYLDYNATTPVDPKVVETINVYLSNHFGNPSSSHTYGQQAAEAVTWARQQVAELIDATQDEIVFTASASEANNMAILGVAHALRYKGRHLITTAIEHPSVLQPFSHLKKEGWDITVLPVDEYGRVKLNDVRQAIRRDTVLVSVMHANNETGTIQPIEDISHLLRPLDIVFHVDAAQSIGKIPVSVDILGADLLTIAGHKLYAPKGIGALYISEGIQLSPVMFGAAQEHDRRTGTENVAYIAGLGTAAHLVKLRLDIEEARLTYKRNMLHTLLSKEIKELQLNGHPDMRLPNTLNLSFPNVSGQALLKQASYVAASVGSACHANNGTASGVLTAMNLSYQRQRGAVRLSIGHPTTEEEIKWAATILISAWKECQQNNMESLTSLKMVQRGNM